MKTNYVSLTAKCSPIRRFCSRGAPIGRTLYLLCGALLFCVPFFAQTLGEITGAATDTSGAVVTGAAVSATNQSTNAVRSATTNDAGIYSFPALQPGIYTVKVEKPGFKTVEQKNLELQVQQTARVDITLQIGQVSDTVEVSANAALLTTEDATMGTVIENKRIEELPLNGRNFIQLIALSPNVSAGFANGGQAGSRQGGSRSQQQISVAGQRREFNYFTLDGVDNTDVNFNTYIILPSIDALQEFKVQTGIFPAEFGRETSQINVSTKAGTNQYHGALFEFLRNDVLDAKPFAFTAARPDKSPFKWNQYGFELGGPISIPKLFNGANKLFFMANYEGFRSRRFNQGLYSVPDAAMRAGNFSELLPNITIYDPATRATGPGGVITATPFPNNVIPSQRFNATAQKLLEFYPPPNGPGLVSNLQVGQNNSTDKDQFIQRIDFNESNASSWFARYSWGADSEISPALKLNGTNLQNRVSQWVLANTRVFSPTVVNEARFGYNSFFNSFGRELAFTRDVVGELKIPGLPSPPPVAYGIPSVGITGFSGFGDDSEGPYENRNHTFQFIDNVSWIRGKHSLRIGAEVRRDRYNQLGNQFARGSFGFDPTATQNPASTKGTGYAFADYLLGYTSRDEDAVALAVTQFRVTSQAYYVDDTWKVTPKLTVNAGLRYELTPPYADKGDSLVNAYVPFVDQTPNVADLSRHPVLVRIGKGDFYQNTLLRFNPAIQVARDGRLGDRLIQTDYSNFAPRLGVAYSPSNRWTVRAGAGVFYIQDTGNPRFDMGRNLSGRKRDEQNASTLDITLSQPFRASGSNNPCGVAPPLVCISTPYVLANVYNRRTPYAIQYLFNIQRELGKSTALEIGYLGSESHRLERLRAFNEAQPGATGSVVSRTPYPELGRIQEVDGTGNANYHSLELKLTRRFSDGLTFLGGYTWSKSIDDGSGIRTLGSDPLFPQNSYCISCERGLSIFDVRHRFVASTLYELPFGKGKNHLSGGIGAALLGNWQLSSILTISSGFPLTVTAGNQSNNGAGFDRPNTTGKNALLPSDQRGPERWFDTSNFVLQPFGTFGNVGRNTLISPGLIQVDGSAIKNFKFTEQRYVQFRVEAFNLPNHPNWSDPDTGILSSGFGKIRGTRSAMRELQFGLKLIF